VSPHLARLHFDTTQTFFGTRISLTQFNFWMFATVGKLLPCALVLLFSVLIMWKLYALRTRTFSQPGGRRQSEIQIDNYRRTTNIVLAIACLFLLVPFMNSCSEFLNLSL
jgi:hypothetical protein